VSEHARELIAMGAENRIHPIAAEPRPREREPATASAPRLDELRVTREEDRVGARNEIAARAE
jgi:hypothetical protein